jgi:chromate transporter
MMANNPVLEVFIYFLRLGITGFGGPLALISIMQEDLVIKRKWISHEEFAHALALIKAMPGALAFMTSVYLGRRRAGYLGGTAAAVGILFPSFALMVLLARFYYLAQQILSIRFFFNGMQAAAIVLMILGLRSLALPYFKISKFWFFFVAGGFIFYLNIVPEPILIIGTGLLGVLWGSRHRFLAVAATPMDLLPAAQYSLSNLSELAWVCLKSGAVVFGSGLAIVPLLQRDFVERLGWLTNQEFLDALALGQVTPGPVLITVTFIGFRVAGILGAIVATVSVFLAGFFHMQTWFPSMVEVLRKQKWVNDFLIPALGVICGVLLVTIFNITEPWHKEGPSNIVILSICGVIAMKWKVPGWAMILSGGLLAIAANFLF